MARTSEIRLLKNTIEISEAVNMYADYLENMNYPIAIDRTIGVYQLINYCKRKKFVRGYFINNKLSAWIYADVCKIDYVEGLVFTQKYYSSILKSKANFTAIKKLHEAMIIEAKRLKINFLTSEGSPMDETFQFSRLLELAGWQRVGYLCVYNL